MSACADHLIDLEEVAEMDATGQRIDAQLEFLAAEDDAAGRRAEYEQLQTLVDLADLAYCVTRYDLRTGKLHSQPAVGAPCDPQPATQVPHPRTPSQRRP